MHSFIPNLQINSVSFYVCQTHTVIEASMRKRVLHIHVTNLKYRSAGGSRQWHVQYFASSVFLNPDL